MSDKKFIWEEMDFEEEDEVQVTENDEHFTYESFNHVNTPVENERQVTSNEKSKNTSQRVSRILKPILVLLIFGLAIYGYNNLDILTLTSVETNELIFVTKEDLMKTGGLEIDQNYSRKELRHVSKLISESQVGKVITDYDTKTGVYSIDVEESKPLAMIDGTLYYSDNGEILSTTEKSFVVPVLFDFPSNLVDETLNELNSLEYSIIKEISAIELIKEYDENSLVLLQMNDGNYVEIYLNQIETKMPYYLQMQGILKQKNGNKSGLIHLDIGDYYEPIS